MGVMNHNAVIATTWNKGQFEQMWAWAMKEFPPHLVCRTMEETTNGYWTIVICPDGSKEGWDASDVMDALRDRLINRLEADNYEDGSSSWEWVEVGFGEYGQKVLRGNNVNCYSDAEYALAED